MEQKRKGVGWRTVEQATEMRTTEFKVTPAQEAHQPDLLPVDGQVNGLILQHDDALLREHGTEYMG